MLDSDLLLSLENYNWYKKYCFQNGLQPIFEDKKLDSILSNRYAKVSRIKKRFVYLISRYKFLYFITFTLNDYYINLSDRTRKDLIKHSLYSFDSNIKYILNIDYGKTTERLHYHCIVATNDNNDLSSFLKSFYPCFSYVEKIRFTSSDIKRVSKYINKLSNHATKSSTRNSRTLYNFKGYDKFEKSNARFLYFYDSYRLGLT